MKNEEQTREDKLEILMSRIWPGGFENPSIYQGVIRDGIKKIIEHAPREMCDLLGKLEEYNDIYEAEDTQTPQAFFQCEDITLLPSQQPSFFWSTPPIPTKRYSIQVGSQEPIILGITRERQEGIINFDAEEKSKPLRQLAFFWVALDPSREPQDFFNELNRIADPASSTQSNIGPAEI